MAKPKSSFNAKQPATNLDQWLVSRGFRGNPFKRWNAEHDQDLPNYFVDLGEFDESLRLELLNLTEPCVVFAQRGCGKTAQRQMLAAHCRPINRASPRLAVVYTYGGFERVLRSAKDDVEQVRPIHHVSTILNLALTALMDEAEYDADVQSALASSDVASRLSEYVVHFAPHLANVSTHERSYALDNLSSPELLHRFSELVKGAGLDSCVVLMDGLDEFPLTASDTSHAVSFLAPLLGTLSLIECPGWAFKFFLPQGLEQALADCHWFRNDRLCVFSSITWDRDDLLALIEQRLTHFSDRKPPYENLAQLCEDPLARVINEELVARAMDLPRPALVLADMLLQEHCRQPNPPELIALGTWEQVKDKWSDSRSDFTVDETLLEVQQAEAAKLVPSSVPCEPGHLALQVDEEKGLVWIGEYEIRSEINPKDYSVLACLYRHRSNVCSKSQIAQEAWAGDQAGGVSDQAIAASVARLRRVLERFALTKRYIETVRGRKRTEGGYRLHPEGFD
jgi:hypothetical protein